MCYKQQAEKNNRKMDLNGVTLHLLPIRKKIYLSDDQNTGFITGAKTWKSVRLPIGIMINFVSWCFEPSQPQRTT